MLRLGLFAAIVAITLATGAYSQPAEPEEHEKGLEPLSPEEFAALPKTPTYRAYLPVRVDLGSHFPTPGDQGKEGSCVAWAVGYAARSYYVSASEGRSVHVATNIPSPAYIYDALIFKGGAGFPCQSTCACGSRIIDALDLLKSGGLSLGTYPYRAGQCRVVSNAERSSATDFRIADWLAVDPKSLDQVKGELVKGNPVVIGIRSRGSLDRLKRDQIYHVREDAGITAGHGLTVVGYDEQLQAFRVINSWGLGWADGGFGWIGYDAFRIDVDEAYVMRTIGPIPPKPIPVVPKPEPAPTPIAGLECGHVTEARRDGKTVFTGFVGSDADLARLSDQARAANALVEVAVRPWPQCEFLLTLEKALEKPDHPIVEIEIAGRLTEKSEDSATENEAGDYLKFTVTTPPYPSFLHAAYVQADGSVVNLLQPENQELVAYPPSAKIVLGDLARSGAKFKVAPPYGREMLIVLAGRSPVFGASRPVQETEREFLTALREALYSKADPSAADRTISAGVAAIVTSAASVPLIEKPWR